MVIVVCGPPGSGKTTYVEERRRPGDLVWDMHKFTDVVAQQPWFAYMHNYLSALRSSFITWLTTTPSITAYVIVTTIQDAEEVTRRYRTTSLVYLPKHAHVS